MLHYDLACPVELLKKLKEKLNCLHSIVRIVIWTSGAPS